MSWLRRLCLDRDEHIVLVDAHVPNLLERFPQLASAHLDDAMYAVDERGVIYEGFDAFRVALRAMRGTRSWIWTWSLPGIAPLGRAIYRHIARNRHSYGCDSACATPSNRGST